MTFIVTALMIEAAPIIKHFKLKKDMNIHTYQVYKSSDTVLIISGVGKVKSAMAAVYLLSNFKASGKDILLNIGFCGTDSSKYKLGSLLLIHKVTDIDTGWDYYPDVFAGHNLPREALFCYSKPVRKDALNGKTNIFCDMESAGIMEAAKKFIYAHQVVILKVVSDYLNTENLDRELMQGYLIKNLPFIEQIIKELKELYGCVIEMPLEEEQKLLNIISENLKFSKAMKNMLFKEIKKAKQRGQKPITVLEFFTETKSNSKVEGKKIFEQISQKLRENPF